MVIGVLQIEVLVEDAMSLKDKRRVVSSLKDTLHREHQVAVAEVDNQDSIRTATLGIAAVSNSVQYVQGMLDKIVEKLRYQRRFILADHQIEILTGYK